MRTAKFSIIIPIYNAEKYVEECVISVLNQTYKNIEVILINDGSTDRSHAIALELASLDSRVTLYNTPNSGVSAARNTGLSKAGGAYVVYIDADDYLVDTNVLEELDIATSLDCDLIMYDIATHDLPSNDLPEPRVYAGREQIDQLLPVLVDKEYINSPCNKAYKRELIDKHHIRFNEQIRVGEDLLFNIDYFRHCNTMYYLRKQLYFYRSNDVSATNKYQANKYFELMFVNNVLTDWLKTKGNSDLMNIAASIRFKNIFWCIGDLNRDDCNLSTAEKVAKINLYKTEDPKLIVKTSGPKVFMQSLVYSYCSAQSLYQLLHLRSITSRRA